MWVVHAVPDALEDGCEGRDADPGPDQEGRLEFEDVFGGGAEGAVDVDARQHFADRGVDVMTFGVPVNADDGRTSGSGVSVGLGLELAAQGCREGFGEVADDTDVD